MSKAIPIAYDMDNDSVYIGSTGPMQFKQLEQFVIDTRKLKYGTNGSTQNETR